MSQENPEVYIAGPLFNSEENYHNMELARMFRESGYDVFNPFEDGIEGAVQTNLEGDELIRRIYDLDSARVRSARIFIANLNGSQVDDGTATEIGIASESQRIREGVEVMIGYFNDTRCLAFNMIRNPLPFGPFLCGLNTIVNTREKVVSYALEHFPPLNKAGSRG